MAELTAQQIEFAVAAFENVAGHAATGELLSMAERMRRAAPFLQLPWDEPIKEEIDRACDDCDAGGDNFRSTLEYLIKEFVRRRNAVIHPKPVDPRWKAILKLTMSWDPESAHEKADEILAALDEVK